jgi:hypothetical protein
MFWSVLEMYRGPVKMWSLQQGCIYDFAKKKFVMKNTMKIC